MQEAQISSLRSGVRDVQDFPQPGIVFKDITPILSDAKLLKISVDLLADTCREHKAEKIVGIDARGFLFGSAVAYKLGIGFIPVRKKGKLPYKTERFSYALEYGTSEVEIHVDALQDGKNVVLVDDLLATGGTSGAAIKLIEQVGGRVAAAAFLIELEFLNGRQNLPDLPVISFLKY